MPVVLPQEGEWLAKALAMASFSLFEGWGIAPGVSECPCLHPSSCRLLRKIFQPSVCCKGAGPQGDQGSQNYVRASRAHKPFRTTCSFRAELVEVQRGSVICPRPHSKPVGKIRTGSHVFLSLPSLVLPSSEICLQLPGSSPRFHQGEGKNRIWLESSFRSSDMKGAAGGVWPGGLSLTH